MCVPESESGRWMTRESGVKSRSWTASATKTIQLARRRTSASRLRSAPSSHASRTPRSVRAPRITSGRRHPRPRVRAELLVESDELGHPFDLPPERADDLSRDRRGAVGNGELPEQRGDATANDVEALLVGHEHRHPELVVPDPAHRVVGAEELAEPALGVVDEALGHELAGDDADLVECSQVDEKDSAARRQVTSLLGGRGLGEPLDVRRAEMIDEDAEEVLLDRRGTALETEREPQLASVEVAQLEPAAAREVELGEGLVPRG